MLGQGLAKGLTLLGPLYCIFETDAGEGFHGHNQLHTLQIEVAHNGFKTFVFLAHQVAYRHSHIVEI